MIFTNAPHNNILTTSFEHCNNCLVSHSYFTGSLRTKHMAVVVWFWREQELPSHLIKKYNLKMAPNELLLNTATSLDADVDVETIIGKCKVNSTSCYYVWFSFFVLMAYQLLWVI